MKMLFDDADIAKMLHEMRGGKHYHRYFDIDEPPIVRFMVKHDLIKQLPQEPYANAVYEITLHGMAKLACYAAEFKIGTQS